MYFRMLKKDLKDKVGLNIVLCIFMIVAATLIVMSTGFVYTFIAGAGQTYDKCNTSDIILVMDKSMSAEEKQRRIVSETFEKYPEIGEISISERVYIGTNRLEFENVDRRTVRNLYARQFMIAPVTYDQNIPYDMNNELFTLGSGCIAIPEVMANDSRSHVGDKIRITTDLGNTYEFAISHIFKDPGTSMVNKILFSDADIEVLYGEFTSKVDLYEVQLITPFSSVSELQKWGWDLINEITDLGENGTIEGRVREATTGKSNLFTDNAMIALIISIFMGLMGLAILILIFMTISFTLQATIKREEREIGTMKAIGVDSLSYKTLFIVKYLVFAAAGGVIGLIAGVPLEKLLVSRFVINTLSPDSSVIIGLGLAGSLVFILIIIGFSFFSLRRMNRISVMDMIHGENRGERFSRIPGASLNRSKRISVPFFLAIQDIVRKMKRYIFLVISYTVAMLILFLIFQLKSTVVSDEYRRTYWYTADRELMIRPEDSLRDELVSLTGSYRNVFLYYEKYFNENGIPLNIQIMDIQTGYMTDASGRETAEICFGDYDINRMVFVEGGHAPRLENEVAVSHYIEKTKGIKIGDVVTLEYEVYGEDGFTTEFITRDFIVTAYVENLGNIGTPMFFTTMNDGNIVIEDWDLFNEGLDCPDDEYPAYIEKMRSLNDHIMIWDYDQVMDYDLGSSFGMIFNLLALVTGLIMTVTLFSMSFLYQQIFIEEETSDIAMLKSMGFDKGSIREWHYIRFILLILIGTVISVILSFTLSRVVFEMIGCIALGTESFKIAVPTLPSVIFLPVGLVLIISAVMAASFKTMDQIKIWKIRNE